MLRVVVLVGAATTMLCGCGSTGDPAAAAAATAFTAAVASGDGAAACAMLTERARERIEAFGRVCSTDIVRLPAATGPVTAVEVWGDSAQVRFAGDTLFLARFDDGWHVRAAGCQPQAADVPYSCQVEG
jgi:hypothetical protein